MLQTRPSFTKGRVVDVDLNKRPNLRASRECLLNVVASFVHVDVDEDFCVIYDRNSSKEDSKFALRTQATYA